MRADDYSLIVWLSARRMMQCLKLGASQCMIGHTVLSLRINKKIAARGVVYPAKNMPRVTCRRPVNER